MDGRLTLSRVVRKSQTFAEIYKADGEKTLVQVDCLTPEVTPRPLVGLLCNDLLVLCKDPSHGENPNTAYDLWAVLRMQTAPQPASVVHGSTLRVVDNKAVLYFEAASTSEALTWSRGELTLNSHVISPLTSNPFQLLIPTSQHLDDAGLHDTGHCRLYAATILDTLLFLES